MLTIKDREAKWKAVEKLRRLRAENLRLLKRMYDSWQMLAAATGKDPSFLCALARENPTRVIGEVLARDIEARLKLPSGWLDQTH